MVFIFIIGILLSTYIVYKLKKEELKYILWVTIPIIGIILEYITLPHWGPNMESMNSFTQILIILLSIYLVVYMLIAIFTKKFKARYILLLLFTMMFSGSLSSPAEADYEDFLEAFYTDIPFIIICSLIYIYITNKIISIFESKKNVSNVNKIEDNQEQN